MKNIQLTTEGTWVELVPVVLTESEKTLLASTNEQDEQARTALVTEIKTRSEKALVKAESDKAKAIYLSLKPTLKETDVYQLISANMVLDGETGTGIINYRVNGEHKQIRF